MNFQLIVADTHNMMSLLLLSVLIFMRLNFVMLSLEHCNCYGRRQQQKEENLISAEKGRENLLFIWKI
jgi:hypothetical protein